MTFNIKHQLEKYTSVYHKENIDKLFMLTFLEHNSRPFDRTTLEGHFTGSALVVNRDFSKILLNHHLGLDKWFQFGGHADGNSDLLAVAIRELEEESGIVGAELYSEELFDIDIHQIPFSVKKNEPQHYHFDVRFLFLVDESVPINISTDESKEIKWVSVEDIPTYTRDDSFLRMVKKVLEYASPAAASSTTT